MLSPSSVWLSGFLHPWLARGMFNVLCACKADSVAHDAGCSWTDVFIPSLPRPLSPRFPPPVLSSQNDSGTAVTADAIATRHHWCYDNSKPSLSLIHRSILGCSKLCTATQWDCDLSAWVAFEVMRKIHLIFHNHAVLQNHIGKQINARSLIENKGTLIPAEKPTPESESDFHIVVDIIGCVAQ